jgi:hypothetical protein
VIREPIAATDIKPKKPKKAEKTKSKKIKSTSESLFAI